VLRELKEKAISKYPEKLELINAYAKLVEYMLRTLEKSVHRLLYLAFIACTEIAEFCEIYQAVSLGELYKAVMEGELKEKLPKE